MFSQAWPGMHQVSRLRQSKGKLWEGEIKIWNINQCVLKVAELSKGGNKEVPRWLQKCDLELKKRRETEVKMYKEMFGSDFKPEAWE